MGPLIGDSVSFFFPPPVFRFGFETLTPSCRRVLSLFETQFLVVARFPLFFATLRRSFFSLLFMRG